MTDTQFLGVVLLMLGVGLWASSKLMELSDRRRQRRHDREIGQRLRRLDVIRDDFICALDADEPDGGRLRRYERWLKAHKEFGSDV
jgi:hypothetical protein